MFRVLHKSTLLLSGIVIFNFISISCFADVSTMQNGLSTTNVIQKPGDYYTDPSMPTPNPDVFPPPPPRSSYLPTQPFMPVISNQFMPTKDEAQKLLSGYRNPSLPTPNPDLAPPPPPVTTSVSTATSTTTTTTQTTTTATNQGAAASSPPQNALTSANQAANSSTSGATGGPGSGGGAGSSNTSASTQQSNTASSNLTDLQNCVPGTYAFPSQVKPITTNTYYGGANNPPPMQTYSVSGMQNGKCIVSITQSAVVPPTVQNGTLTPPSTVAPAATISKCSLSPNDLSNMTQQAQKNQMGGYYGSTPANQNYYSQQSTANSCSSYLVINGAAVPYKSYP